MNILFASRALYLLTGPLKWEVMGSVRELQALHTLGCSAPLLLVRFDCDCRRFCYE